MTIAAASKLTRYFAAGVVARIWCYAGNGQWEISIVRDDRRIAFCHLDELERTVLDLYERVASHMGLDIYPPRGREWFEGCELTLTSDEDAREVALELERAVAY